MIQHHFDLQLRVADAGWQHRAAQAAHPPIDLDAERRQVVGQGIEHDVVLVKADLGQPLSGIGDRRVVIGHALIQRSGREEDPLELRGRHSQQASKRRISGLQTHQLVLGQHRQLGQIGRALEVLGPHPGRVHPPPRCGRVLIGVFHDKSDPFIQSWVLPGSHSISFLSVDLTSPPGAPGPLGIPAGAIPWLAQVAAGQPISPASAFAACSA